MHHTPAATATWHVTHLNTLGYHNTHCRSREISRFSPLHTLQSSYTCRRGIVVRHTPTYAKENFSKIGPLLDELHSVTIQLTFEKFDVSESEMASHPTKRESDVASHLKSQLTAELST